MSADLIEDLYDDEGMDLALEMNAQGHAFLYVGAARARTWRRRYPSSMERKSSGSDFT